MPFRRTLLLGVLLLPVAAYAQTEPDPSQAASFVRQAGAELAGVVAGATSPQDKQARLGPYLLRVVDEDGVARFCLGRYWQTATPEQRTEYLRLFRLVLLRGVVTRLGDYQAGAVKVSVSTPVQKPDGIYVPTVVEREGNKPVNITWLVTDDGGTMRIADVVAEGMSLRMTAGRAQRLRIVLGPSRRRRWRVDCSAEEAGRRVGVMPGLGQVKARHDRRVAGLFGGLHLRERWSVRPPSQAVETHQHVVRRLERHHRPAHPPVDLQIAGQHGH